MLCNACIGFERFLIELLSKYIIIYLHPLIKYGAVGMLNSFLFSDYIIDYEYDVYIIVDFVFYFFTLQVCMILLVYKIMELKGSLRQEAERRELAEVGQKQEAEGRRQEAVGRRQAEFKTNLIAITAISQVQSMLVEAGWFNEGSWPSFDSNFARNSLNRSRITDNSSVQSYKGDVVNMSGFRRSIPVPPWNLSFCTLLEQSSLETVLCNKLFDGDNGKFRDFMSDYTEKLRHLRAALWQIHAHAKQGDLDESNFQKIFIIFLGDFMKCLSNGKIDAVAVNAVELSIKIEIVGRKKKNLNGRSDVAVIHSGKGEKKLSEWISLIELKAPFGKLQTTNANLPIDQTVAQTEALHKSKVLRGIAINAPVVIAALTYIFGIRMIVRGMMTIFIARPSWLMSTAMCFDYLSSLSLGILRLSIIL